ncbi:hypothetical protein WICPIJ_001314 [Wickerhamomyces pijperi]|uniref:F-box domain-containing protein n=1 Tax=Wickerhamomyces pijperi TaxID=599730 RepID=A0A9P8TQQ7_WICPI|nr:hypothetical protein WICPIJ_001314 [Wickerhamomyces pijperi]
MFEVLPNEILIAITKLLPLSDLTTLLSFEYFQSRLGGLFRHIEVSARKDGDDRCSFWQTTKVPHIRDIYQLPHKVDQSLIYLIEIHDWENFNLELFSYHFKHTHNFIIDHVIGKQTIDTRTVILEQYHKTIDTILECFDSTTLVLNTPDYEDHTICAATFDPARLIISQPVERLTICGSKAMPVGGGGGRGGKVAMDNVWELILDSVSQSTIDSIDYLGISELSMFLNLEYEQDTEQLLPLVFPREGLIVGDNAYHLSDVNFKDALNINLHWLNKLVNLKLPRLRQIRAKLVETSSGCEEVGVFGLESENLKVLNIGVYTKTLTPSFERIQCPNLRHIRIAGECHFDVMDDRWIRRNTNAFPNLVSLEVFQLPQLMHLFKYTDLSNLRYLKTAVYNDEDRLLLESLQFPSLERLNFKSFHPSDRLAYPILNAPLLCGFTLSSVSSQLGSSATKTLRGISTAYPLLEVLVLDLFNVRYQGLNEWDAELPNLKFLGLTGPLFEVIKSLKGVSFPKLEFCQLIFSTPYRDDLVYRYDLDTPKLKCLHFNRLGVFSGGDVVAGGSRAVNTHLLVQGYSKLVRLSFDQFVNEVTVKDCVSLKLIRGGYSTVDLNRITGENLPSLRYLDINSRRMTLERYQEVEMFKANTNSSNILRKVRKTTTGTDRGYPRTEFVPRDQFNKADLLKYQYLSYDGTRDFDSLIRDCIHLWISERELPCHSKMPVEQEMESV